MSKIKDKESKEDSNADLGGKAIAISIRKIDKGVQQLTSCGLRMRTIILLISDASGVGRGTVGKVIEGLTELKDRYLNE